MTELVQVAPVTQLAIRRSFSVPTSASGLNTSTLIRLVLAETRPAVQFVIVLRVISFFCTGTGMHFRSVSPAAWLGILGWSFLGLAIYLLNGITDITGDRRNGSRRPIASGRLPVATAIQTTVFLAGAGLLLCTLASNRLAMLGVLFLILGYTYSVGPAALKSTRLGFAIAVGGGAFLCYMAGAVLGGGVDFRLVAFGASMALWVGLCSATKDLSDVDGDRLAGRQTWPVLLGDRGARRLISAISAALGIWFLLAAPALSAETRAAEIVGGAGAITLAAMVLLSPREATRSAGRRPYRMFMTVQYAVNCTVLAGALS
jgi:4-hydroxybenzoate polyprenyltransferase